MFVTALELINFRSYSEVKVNLNPGVNVFVGNNGQGKTNLVEAIEYASTLASHRVSSDTPLVKQGHDQAIVRVQVQAGLEDERNALVELEINPGKANRAKLNRAPLPKVRDLLGTIRTVVFSPIDLKIIRGDPADRRDFLDSVVTIRWPRMAGVKSDYEKVLRQRNTLLKSMAGRSWRDAGTDSEATLQVWTDHLARLGAELLHARLDTLTDLIPYASSAYQNIAPINNEISASYKTSLDLSSIDHSLDVRTQLTELLIQECQQRKTDEISRGVSLVGPHRDDMFLSIGELPAKGYTSHGESWSLALALRLGTFQLLQYDNVQPILILDDVFAELDQTRRRNLADAITSAEQILITAAVGSDVPDLLSTKNFKIVDRQVIDE